ncbi:MAG: primosomal protein N', partial [Actinobacteria bacterium]|nr:primosomal protein N' [Actinomycetota bacterium]
MKNTTEKERYADVILETAVKGLDRPFCYIVPDNLGDVLDIGSLVMVPFGGRQTLGYVTGFPSRCDYKKLKEISHVLDEPPLFDFDGQRLCRWISRRYMSSLSQSFKLLMPPGRGRNVKKIYSLAADPVKASDSAASMGLDEAAIIEAVIALGGKADYSTLKDHLGQKALSRAGKLEEEGLLSSSYVLSKPAVKPKTMLVVHATGALEGGCDIEKLPKRQLEIVSKLLSRGGTAPQSELLRQTGAGSSSLKSLASKGMVEINKEECERKPVMLPPGFSIDIPAPNNMQNNAIKEITHALDKSAGTVFLLEGVTGSGKTEVYLRCIEHALDSGRNALALVPEISLTPQTLERFESRFPGQVGVLHSKLGTGERYDQWRGVRDGRVRVLVGARSALFAPVPNLGIIAIDEEHEPSYKSDTAPRYHARDVAVALARMSGAVVILGSATPSFESTKRAQAGIYRHVVLPERVDSRPLPSIEIVDMKEIGGAGTLPLLSPLMLDALSRTIEKGNQAILFLNRRGFSNYLQCRACGHIIECDICAVSLSYHLKGNMLLCHHCGRKWDPPGRCPVCDRGPIKRYGAGTQKVEDELKENLHGVTYVRMDSDTTSTKDAHRRLLDVFKSGKAQVLIGTQMIAKGLDIPGVTLVGVINADTALALPDFRAGERTYQLLTQ